MDDIKHLPSGGAVVGCIALMVLASIILILSSQPKPGETSHATIVPEPGTAEFETYKQTFAETHGREWTVDDQLTSIKNGLQVQFAFIGPIAAVPVAYFHIYDWIWWFKDRKAYRNYETNDKPATLAQKLTGTAIICLILFFLCGYGTFIAPHMVEPIT